MRAVRATAFFLLASAGLGGFAAAQFAARPVVVVPVTGAVDEGMTHLIQRSVALANADGAAAIVLDVDSSDGLQAAAARIRDTLFTAREPVIAYVAGRADSVAALVALAANRIAMAPGASIGAAQPAGASPSAVSALRAEFASTALRNGRNPQVAAAMVDSGVDLPQIKRTGTILTLDSADALQTRISQATAPTLSGALRAFGLGSAPRLVQQYTWGERVARISTNPAVSAVLITIGLLGLLIEMLTLHGIAGVTGVAALALFFGAHVYAGFSNELVVALAVLGLLGILLELHVVPGHTVAGVLGSIALLLAMLLAFGAPFFFVGIEMIATAVVLTVIAFSAIVRAVPRNAWMDRLALADAQGPQYVAAASRQALLGQSGTAMSYLRPAGFASIEGQRVDVLTKGEFIAQGTPIRVVRVEGARVFVEASHPPQAGEIVPHGSR